MAVLFERDCQGNLYLVTPVSVYKLSAIHLLLWGSCHKEYALETRLNSLGPVRCQWNFRYVIFLISLLIEGWGISCEIALSWTSLDLVMINNHWFRSWLGGVNRQQWVKLKSCKISFAHNLFSFLKLPYYWAKFQNDRTTEINVKDWFRDTVYFISWDPVAWWLAKVG